MTGLLAVAWYFTACGIVTAAAGLFDSWRGITGAAAASLLCFVPLAWAVVRRRVAGPADVAKLRAKRGLDLLLEGLIFRLGFVLIGAFVAYSAAHDQLGVGFWISVLILYQVALGLTVALATSRRRSVPAAGPSGAVGD